MAFFIMTKDVPDSHAPGSVFVHGMTNNEAVAQAWETAAENCGVIEVASIEQSVDTQAMLPRTRQD